MGDYLAEVTMLVLGKAKSREADAGYGRTFLGQLSVALEDVAANRIKAVVNAGGLNPPGLAVATRKLLLDRGYELSVAHIDGTR